ncbi:hypothetical protein H6P81_015523 [Aristolochia fimbriata]|uniref:Uncharacterized protein n=1 Tax=Aristolochia fimbriata TaxID=158543 RepID=A0AAV7EAD9_ARIFI|nr:hypothetical protein H6P81_015523 [Aristolochia fimbriata]
MVRHGHRAWKPGGGGGGARLRGGSWEHHVIDEISTGGWGRWWGEGPTGVAVSGAWRERGTCRPPWLESVSGKGRKIECVHGPDPFDYELADNNKMATDRDRTRFQFYTKILRMMNCMAGASRHLGMMRRTIITRLLPTRKRR